MITKNITGKIYIDEKTEVTNPVLSCSKIIIDTVNKTVTFEYIATTDNLTAGRTTPPLDYSKTTTAAMPTLTHCNTIITKYLSDNTK